MRRLGEVTGQQTGMIFQSQIRVGKKGTRGQPNSIGIGWPRRCPEVGLKKTAGLARTSREGRPDQTIGSRSFPSSECNLWPINWWGGEGNGNRWDCSRCGRDFPRGFLRRDWAAR